MKNQGGVSSLESLSIPGRERGAWLPRWAWAAGTPSGPVLPDPSGPCGPLASPAVCLRPLLTRGLPATRMATPRPPPWSPFCEGQRPLPGAGPSGRGPGGLGEGQAEFVPRRQGAGVPETAPLSVRKEASEWAHLGPRTQGWEARHAHLRARSWPRASPAPGLGCVSRGPLASL